MKKDAPETKILEYMRDVPGVFAGYTTKAGGVPESPFVRQDLFRELGIENRIFIRPRQVHGTRIAVIGDNADAFEPFPETDGIVTNRADVVLTTIHADCLAVFLYDPVNRAIGLCHAGWRGTAGGIAVKTLEVMKKTYGTEPKNVRAAVSAGISQCCFQVGEEVVDAFRKNWPFTDEYVTRDDVGISTCTACDDMARLAESIRRKRNEATLRTTPPEESPRYHMNLKGLNKRMLMEAGVPSFSIEADTHCTCCEPKLFFSYRREKGTRARQGAILYIK